MNQHISSMLETLSSLRRKNSETTQPTSTDEKMTSFLQPPPDDDQKDVSDVESMSSKTKSLFKDLISDNGATNTILQNCTNFIKCTSTISSHLNANASTVAAPPSSSPSPSPSTTTASNGSCKQQQKVNNHDDGNDNNNQKQVKTMSILHPTANETTQGRSISISSKKRNSIAPNGEFNVLRELSPSPRSTRRKSSYDSRMFRGAADEDVGKHSGAVMRPLKTKNIITKNETFDTLHYKAMDVSREYF
jgi:hypothetical protein